MVAWVTAADVQSWLGPNVSDTDALSLATAASADAESFLERDVTLQTDLTEYYDGNGTNYILLNNWPVVSITSVTIDGLPPLVPAAPRTPGWRIDAFNPRKLEFAGYSKVWRGLVDAITVVGTYGYDLTQPYGSPKGPGLPMDLVTAIQLIAAAIYNAQAADPNLASESTAGVFSGSFTPLGVGAIPPGARDKLQRYRRISP